MCITIIVYETKICQTRERYVLLVFEEKRRVNHDFAKDHVYGIKKALRMSSYF